MLDIEDGSQFALDGTDYLILFRHSAERWWVSIADDPTVSPTLWTRDQIAEGAPVDATPAQEARRRARRSQMRIDALIGPGWPPIVEPSIDWRSAVIGAAMLAGAVVVFIFIASR